MSLFDWQRYVEGDTVVFVAGANVSMVTLADAVSNSQPQSVAAGFSGA